MSRGGAESRLQRLLVMVPWIMQQDGPEVGDVCERFGATEDDLASDLELLFLCGLYPFTPDTLIEADIVDGRVWIRSADQFQRPPRFTAEEALTLLTAASTIADLEGNQQNTLLRNALNKLSRSLGLEDDVTVDVELSAAVPQTLAAVQQATAARQVIAMDYYSYGRDAWSRRKVEPYQVFNSEGQWYLQGRAQEVGEVRNFRIDRMNNVDVLEATFAIPENPPEARTYQARDDDPTVVIELDKQGTWVLDQYPVEQVKRLKNGKTRATMRVSEKLWFQRLLLRLGRHAKVTQGDIDVEASARQILARYLRTHQS